MGIIRWDPFSDLTLLQERMNKMFEESLARSANPDQENSLSTWSPAVDILEQKDEIVLLAELPGIALEDVDLQVKDDVLIMRGERLFEQETKTENYHRLERPNGTFSRSFKLPSTIDRTNIKAKLKDGILEVKLPKMIKKVPRKISIETKK